MSEKRVLQALAFISVANFAFIVTAIAGYQMIIGPGPNVVDPVDPARRDAGSTSQAHGARYGVTGFCLNGNSDCYLWDGSGDTVTATIDKAGLSVSNFRSKQRASAAFAILAVLFAGAAAVVSVLTALEKMPKEKHLIACALHVLVLLSVIVPIACWGNIQYYTGTSYGYGFALFCTAMGVAFLGAVGSYYAKSGWDGKVALKSSSIYLIVFSVGTFVLIVASLAQASMGVSGSLMTGSRIGVVSWCTGTQCYVWDDNSNSYSDNVRAGMATLGVSNFQEKQRASAAFGVMGCIFAGVAAALSLLVANGKLPTAQHSVTMLLLVVTAVFSCIVVGIWGQLLNDSNVGAGAAFGMFCASIATAVLGALTAYFVKEKGDAGGARVLPVSTADAPATKKANKVQPAEKVQPAAAPVASK